MKNSIKRYFIIFIILVIFLSIANISLKTYNNIRRTEIIKKLNNDILDQSNVIFVKNGTSSGNVLDLWRKKNKEDKYGEIIIEKIHWKKNKGLITDEKDVEAVTLMNNKSKQKKKLKVKVKFSSFYLEESYDDLLDISEPNY